MSRRLSTEEFIERARKMHGSIYDYSLVEYKNVRAKVRIICPVHGEFLQAAGHHLEGVGCPGCFGTPNKGIEKFIEEADKIHDGRYDYSEAEYRTARTKLKIICPEHGEFWCLPTNHLKGCGCPRCHLSKGEKRIYEVLLENGLKKDKDFVWQKRFKELGRLSYDFYIPSKNLLVEYNGRQHYEPVKYYGGYRRFLRQKHFDWLKRSYARKHGLELLVIPYAEYGEIEEKLNAILKEG